MSNNRITTHCPTHPEHRIEVQVDYDLRDPSVKYSSCPICNAYNDGWFAGFWVGIIWLLTCTVLAILFLGGR